MMRRTGGRFCADVALCAGQPGAGPARLGRSWKRDLPRELFYLGATQQLWTRLDVYAGTRASVGVSRAVMGDDGHREDEVNHLDRPRAMRGRPTQPVPAAQARRRS